jgi:hypothetical protein
MNKCIGCGISMSTKLICGSCYPESKLTMSYYEVQRLYKLTGKDMRKLTQHNNRMPYNFRPNDVYTYVEKHVSTLKDGDVLKKRFMKIKNAVDSEKNRVAIVNKSIDLVIKEIKICCVKFDKNIMNEQMVRKMVESYIDTNGHIGLIDCVSMAINNLDKAYRVRAKKSQNGIQSQKLPIQNNIQPQKSPTHWQMLGVIEDRRDKIGYFIDNYMRQDNHANIKNDMIYTNYVYKNIISLDECCTQLASVYGMI